MVLSRSFENTFELSGQVSQMWAYLEEPCPMFGLVSWKRLTLFAEAAHLTEQLQYIVPEHTSPPTLQQQRNSGSNKLFRFAHC